MMPASRWQTSMAELFDWMGQADEELRMLVPPIVAGIGKKENASDETSAAEGPKYPEVLPILPIIGRPLLR